MECDLTLHERPNDLTYLDSSVSDPSRLHSTHIALGISRIATEVAKVGDDRTYLSQTCQKCGAL